MSTTQFQFHNVFSSCMVLQREEPIVLSGRATKGDRIEVHFNGNSANATANGSDEWRVVLPAMKAGGPYVITAENQTTGESLMLDDVMVGDVWLCSGQSNMQCPLWGDQEFFRSADGDKEAAQANYPNLRLCNCGYQMDTSKSPFAPFYDLVNGQQWTRCTPETAANYFSAVGYYFGKQLHLDLNIPIGIMDNSVGGTDILAWISSDKLHACDWKGIDMDLETIQRKKQSAQQMWEECLENHSNGKHFRKWAQDFEMNCPYPKEITQEEYDDSQWDTVQNGLPSVSKLGRYAHRLSFEVPKEALGGEGVVCLGTIDDADITYLNGQQIGRTEWETERYWMVQRRYSFPAGLLHPGKNVLTVLHDNQFNVGVCNLKQIQLNIGERNYFIRPAIKSRCIAELPTDFPPRPDVAKLASIVIVDEDNSNFPSTLFNARMAPWMRYNFKGFVWYQGCNNNGQLTYYQLHKMLIEDWREKWHKPHMPFLLVQLASFYQNRPATPFTKEELTRIPIEECPPYAVTREIQAEMPHIFHQVGMVVTFDIGEAADIHPSNKRDVGYRLAKKAEKMLYNESIIADGPTFAGIRFEDEQIRVLFTNTGSGLTTSDGLPPKGFLVGDRAGRLYPAEATIEGNTVVVKSSSTLSPQRVRYAFTSWCEVNLCNQEGFPAAPFRSDKTDYSNMF